MFRGGRRLWGVPRKLLRSFARFTARTAGVLRVSDEYGQICLLSGTRRSRPSAVTRSRSVPIPVKSFFASDRFVSSDESVFPAVQSFFAVASFLTLVQPFVAQGFVTAVESVVFESFVLSSRRIVTAIVVRQFAVFADVHGRFLVLLDVRLARFTPGMHLELRRREQQRSAVVAASVLVIRSVGKTVL